MFGKSAKDNYVQQEIKPLSISGCNDSPYMQEMLRNEEKRRTQHTEEAYNRQHGYIK